MTPEHRQGVEFRVQGRTLSGVALRYGDISPDFRERFEPGAFGELRSIALNLQHDRGMVITPDAMLTDGPRELRVRADLPEGSAALKLVRRGALSGFSVEFHAVAERREGGLRVIKRAELTGLALVDRGAYPASKAEVRAKSGRVLRGSIPYDTELACECIAQGGSGAECISLARFSKMAGDAMAEVIDEALAVGAMEAQLTAVRDVLAVHKDYARPLASARRGTLRAVSEDDRLALEVDLPSGPLGDNVIAASEAAGVITRPLIDFGRSEFTDTERGREYRRPHLRAILIGSTDARGGWPDALIEYQDPERAAPQWRRRVWL